MRGSAFLLHSLHPLRPLAVALALLVAVPAGAAPAVTPLGPAESAPAPGTNTQATDTEVAEHVAQGRRLYLLGRYQEAIAEYRRAYELRADPQFLMDTAEAYRQLGATERALFYYERYLAAAPNAPDREIVEDRITELELVKAPPPVQAPPAGPPALAAKPRPVWKRWWLWTAVGVAVGAGITAAALSSRSSGPAVPATDLGDRKFY
ncbi:MAG TPA: tetratricopeptide repeat protein [Polyangia bacterium]|nr:tetratricopeptide repeat protein [Polyangia bacterium]